MNLCLNYDDYCEFCARNDIKALKFEDWKEHMTPENMNYD